MIQEIIEEIMQEHNLDWEQAKLFLTRAEKRQSGFATGNRNFPIQYTTRRMRSHVAKQLNVARTVHIRVYKNRGFKVQGWGRQYFKGLVFGMSAMVSAVVNNDVQI